MEDGAGFSRMEDNFPSRGTTVDLEDIRAFRHKTLNQKPTEHGYEAWHYLS